MRISDWSSDVCSSDLGHAAGAGRRHRLAIDFVHHITACEHAGDRGARAARFDLDITVRIEIEVPPEQFGRGMMAERDEPALHIALRHVTRTPKLKLRSDRRRCRYGWCR